MESVEVVEDAMTSISSDMSICTSVYSAGNIDHIHELIYVCTCMHVHTYIH